MSSEAKGTPHNVNTRPNDYNKIKPAATALAPEPDGMSLSISRRHTLRRPGLGAQCLLAHRGSSQGCEPLHAEGVGRARLTVKRVPRSVKPAEVEDNILISRSFLALSDHGAMLSTHERTRLLDRPWRPFARHACRTTSQAGSALFDRRSVEPVLEIPAGVLARAP